MTRFWNYLHQVCLWSNIGKEKALGSKQTRRHQHDSQNQLKSHLCPKEIDLSFNNLHYLGTVNFKYR